MPTLLTERLRSLVLAAAVRNDVEVEAATRIADTAVRGMCSQLGGRSLWLPVSIDAGHALRAVNTNARYREWAKLKAEGVQSTEIANRYGVSRVSVWRGLRKVTGGAAQGNGADGHNPRT